MEKKDILKNFILNHLDIMEASGSSGQSLDFPKFDLYPRDYLKFAKVELDSSNEKDDNLIHIINCLSHLKRALDCQLDIFLYHLNLYDLVKDKNLKFDKKLNFLKDIGVFESTSLSRLNYMRNKMEHNYKTPEIEEIEVYYDLVTAFILVLESIVTIFSSRYEIEVDSIDEDQFRFFRLYYSFETNPKIIFNPLFKDKTKEYSIEVHVSEQEDFAYYLKVLLLLARLDFMKKEYILEALV